MTKALTPIDTEPVRRTAYTLPEAAESIGISERTLSTWLRNGNGPPTVRIGGSVRVPVETLRQWLSDQATKK